MFLSRVGIVTGATVAGMLVLAGPAFAHVTVSAPGATQGGDATFTFQVPTESDTANTIALALQLPTDTPIASIAVQPKTGWSYTLKMGKPSVPVSGDSGPVSQVVTEIDWKVAAGNPGIKPNEFDQFVIDAGPLPKTSTLTFKAIQSYSDGKQVSWIEVPAPGSTAEPEHPAPSVTLAPDSSGSAATSGTQPTQTTAQTTAGKASSGTSNVLAGVALGLAVVAFVLAGAALRTARGKLGGGASSP